VLIAISILLFGHSPFAGILVSAVCGFATVWVTYVLGARGWGRGVGLIAALLLAVSGQHVFYSREALVEADGLFFATLGSLVYLIGTRRLVAGAGTRWQRVRWALLAGGLYGVAFACNNRLVFLPAVLLLVELGLWRDLGRNALRTVVEHAGALAAGVALPLLFIQGLFVAGRQVAKLYGASALWMDYREQFLGFAQMNAPTRLRLDQWPTYPTDVFLMEGPALLVLVPLAILAALRIRRPTDRLLLAWLLVPLALYSVYSTGEIRMRHFSLALPWLMLAGALGVRWLTDRARRVLGQKGEWAAATVLVVLSAGPALVSAARFVAPPSGADSLLAYAAEHKIDRIAGINGPVMGYLMGNDRANGSGRGAFVLSYDDLRWLEGEKYEYLTVDQQLYLFPNALLTQISEAEPVATWPNGNSAYYLADILEHSGIRWGEWDRVLALQQRYAGPATELRLYRLQDILAVPRPPEEDDAAMRPA
jgi:4-amino-4-deoxy-L-arabinose transferase-like glycosyltransferase